MLVDLCNLPVRNDAERAADWDLVLKVREASLVVRPMTMADLLSVEKSKAKSIEETRKLIDSILTEPSPILLESDEMMAIVAAVIVYAGEMLKKKQGEMVSAIAARVKTAMAAGSGS